MATNVSSPFQSTVPNSNESSNSSTAAAATTSTSAPTTTSQIPTHILDTRPHPTQFMNDAAESLEQRARSPTPHNYNTATVKQSKQSVTGVKSFPFQPSKDPPLTTIDASIPNNSQVSAEDTVIIPATPADPRFSHEIVHVEISRADAVYNLNPIHCGKNVVFLNAQDPRFYTRELLSPTLTVWILCCMNIMKSHALKRMFESAWRQNIQVKVMEVDKFELIASRDGLENILYEGAPVELPDCIFNRVGSNVSYFGMAVIRQLENLQCLIFNGLRSIEISRDKMMTVQTLAAHGLPLPKSCLAKFPINLDTIKREFTFPIIIKKVQGSQGKGIIKVDTAESLTDLIDMLDTGAPLIFQEYISASQGRDLRVFVIGGRVVGAMMRVAASGSFKANIHQGGTSRAVKVSPQVEWLVLETVKIIGLDIAGVDLLIDKDTYKICEVNSSPGFEGLERALGENIAIRMLQYMKFRLGVWRRNMKVGEKRRTIDVPIDQTNTTGEQDASIATEQTHSPLRKYNSNSSQSTNTSSIAPCQSPIDQLPPGLKPRRSSGQPHENT